MSCIPEISAMEKVNDDIMETNCVNYDNFDDVIDVQEESQSCRVEIIILLGSGFSKFHRQ